MIRIQGGLLRRKKFRTLVAASVVLLLGACGDGEDLPPPMVVAEAAPAPFFYKIGPGDPATLVRELASELVDADGVREIAGGAADVRLLQAADRTFASLACHSARRAGDHLEPAEQRALLEELDTIPWAPTCPHGRPVAIALERGEIEQRFLRR